MRVTGVRDRVLKLAETVQKTAIRYIMASSGHRNGVSVVECFQIKIAAVGAFGTKETLSYADRVFKRMRCRGSLLGLFDPFHAGVSISRAR